MSRSVSDLRYELRTNGKVRVPRITLTNLFSGLSLSAVPALVAGTLWWIAPFNWGILSLIITLFVCSILVLGAAINDWRKHVNVTPDHVYMVGQRPIPWSDIEAIRTPIARSVLSIQLSRSGFLHHYNQTDPDDDELEFLQNAEDRVVVWILPQSVSPDEIRFLREQVKR